MNNYSERTIEIKSEDLEQIWNVGKGVLKARDVKYQAIKFDLGVLLYDGANRIAFIRTVVPAEDPTSDKKFQNIFWSEYVPNFITKEVVDE